jgi:cysteine desulfurase family protein (TIGR01976 family)
MSHCLLHTNANHGGAFATSVACDALVVEAQTALADFLHAPDPAEIVFGANMTTLTFALSRAVARTWRPGDEVLVTALDHDANHTPWVLAARDAGATVRVVGIRPEDGTLDVDDFRRQLSPRTRWVAFTAASNALGTLTPVRTLVDLAHAVGARVAVDAVHYAPHLRMDVQAWDAEVVVCSAYKFFGPHVGVLWGRRELLAEWPAYKVRPAPECLPDRWMTGTANFAGIAGTLAAVNYLAQLGGPGSRCAALDRAFAQIRTAEVALGQQLLAGLQTLPDVRVYGITAAERWPERVATVAFTHARYTPAELAGRLAEHGIFVWAGNYYALPLTTALGVEPLGMVRVGLLHYNTAAEVERLLALLADW